MIFYLYVGLIIIVGVIAILLGISVALCAIASGQTEYRIKMNEIKMMCERELHNDSDNNN